MRTADGSRASRRAFLLLLASAFLVTTFMAWQSVQTRRVVRSNHAAIERLDALAAAQRAFRVERARRTSATDVRICRQVELLKLANRRAAYARRAALTRNLRLLKLASTPAIVKAADDDLARDLALLKPIDCSKLPSQTGGAFPRD